MPILFVNPARRRRHKAKRAARRRRISISAQRSAWRRSPRKRAAYVAERRKKAAARKRAKKVSTKRRRRTHTKEKRMRKLYGAAAKAHAKKLAKQHRRRKRRKNPSGKRRRRHVARAVRRRRRRRNPHATLAAAKATYASAPRKRRRRRKARKAGKSSKRSRAAKKAARTRAAKKAARRMAAKKAARSRKRRHGGSRKRRHSGRRRHARRRRRHHAAAPRRRRRRARRPGAKRRTGLRSLRRARRSIKYQARRGGLGAAYIRKHKMRTNPAVVGELMSLVRAAVPVAASLYVTRIVVAKVGPMIPGADKLGAFSKPAVAAAVCAGAHFATKKGPLAKWRGPIMLGTGINLIDALVSALAPADVKSMFGLGDSGLYDKALSEYVSTGEYVEMAGLSDYITVDGVEEELGAVQEELGVEEDLGDPRLGGVSTGMLKALPAMRSTATIPARSFTREVPAMDSSYDSASVYAGIFKGGF